MKINREKLLNNTGIKTNSDNKIALKDLAFYMGSLVYWLAHNNKNYTKEQYKKITLLNDIFECIDVYGEEE